MRQLRYILILIVLCAVPRLAWAQESEQGSSFNYKLDRVSHLVPVHKGEYTASVSASFGNLSSSNSDILLLIQDIDASGSVASVKPSVGYFYSDRSMAGARFAYTDIKGEISTASIDLGSVNDLELDIPYISVSKRSYSYGLYHRSYTKVDTKGQFELFSEIELLYGYGSYDIAQDLTGADEILRSKTQSFSVSFNPGISVNIMPNIASFVSFGLGGLSFNKIRQYDKDWNYIGQRTSSQYSLQIDLFAINFGLTLHFWQGEKKGKG